MSALTALALLLPPAHADVAIEAPEGMLLATHSLRVEGLLDHPDAVILAFDGPPGGTVSTHRVYGQGQASQHVLARGDDRNGSAMGAPSLYAMARPAYETWAAATSAEVERQRQACDERGEGCMHISRFVPSYASPSAVLPCGVQVETVTQGPDSGPDLRIEVYKVAALEIAAPDGGACRLDKVATEQYRQGNPYQPASGGCSALAGSAASVLAGLSLLLGLGRRRG